jgi:hypothetical protein
MRFVETKTPAQQSCLMLHRTRQLFIRQQTSVINAIRAHLAEFGIVAPVGRKGVEQLLAIATDASDQRVTEVARACLAGLGAQFRMLKAQILEFDRRIMAGHRSNEMSKRLDAIPGIGPALATEAQWEYAARGGKYDGEDWSQAYDKDGKPIANTWQGIFPVLNTEQDGYAGTAPVGCFPPNGYGLFDMIGNVWELTSDWYVPGHSRDSATNPSGPSLLQVRIEAGKSPSKVIKGGSYLCAYNYCSRYRPTARQPQEVDLGAGHLGFRAVLTCRRARAAGGCTR